MKVAKARFLIETKTGEVYASSRMSIVHDFGVPYVHVAKQVAGKEDQRVYLGDIYAIYIAWTGTEDTKWRALSQSFDEGILPPLGEAVAPDD